jgi:hypothetical protein
LGSCVVFSGAGRVRVEGVKDAIAPLWARQSSLLVLCKVEEGCWALQSPVKRQGGQRRGRQQRPGVEHARYRGLLCSVIVAKGAGFESHLCPTSVQSKHGHDEGYHCHLKVPVWPRFICLGCATAEVLARRWCCQAVLSQRGNSAGSPDNNRGTPWIGVVSPSCSWSVEGIRPTRDPASICDRIKRLPS